MSSGKIKFVLSPNAIVPSKGYPGDAGYDLYTVGDHLIVPGRTESISTGVRIQLPEGYYGRITSRSSTLERHGLVINEGIIDNGWRGELFVMAYSAPGIEVGICVKEGTRIAQLLIHKIHEFEWEAVNELDESERGERGFGSSGT